MLFWSGLFVTLAGTLWLFALALANASNRGESVMDGDAEEQDLDAETLLFSLVKEGWHALPPLAMTAAGILLLGASWFAGERPLGDDVPVSTEFNGDVYIWVVFAGGGFLMVATFTVMRLLSREDD